MNILVLGVGLQGKAVLHDLERSEQVREITAADLNVEAAQEHVRCKGYRKTSIVRLDATSTEDLEGLFRDVRPDAVICMLPPALGFAVATAAVACGVHFVSSSYTGDLVRLDGAARSAGVTLLPEMGMDPGIDLVLCRLALEELDWVHGLHSYGAGVPEPACSDHNPLRYKISWTFDGVLKAYKRPARFLVDGREVRVAGGNVFRPEYGHTVQVPGLGTLEAYPNGDVVPYRDIFGLGREVRDMGRFALRWPGHNALINAWSELGFLEDTPVDVDGCRVSPRRFLVHHLTPRLTFADDERDVVILLARAWGLKGGKPRRVSYWLLDYRDLTTGLFAMNRTVGYTAAIGAQLVLNGTIRKRGLLNPARDVPPRILLSELEKRGMSVQKQVEDHE